MSSLKIWLRSNLRVLPLLLVILAPSVLLAQEAPAAATAAAPAPDLAAQVADLSSKMASNKVALDTVWTLITGFLVFWMNAGFALVESGMCRVKNAVNILSKNFIVLVLLSL